MLFSHQVNTICFILYRTTVPQGRALDHPFSIVSPGTAVWGFLAPFCLNFSFVLMPGWNLRDLVAAICNVYFVVFVCQFIWCFMCLQHFWRLPFEAPVLCLFIKLILVGHWGHFYLVFCLFASRVCFLIRVVSAQSLNQLRIKSWCLTSMIVYNICAWG